jgi:hypothetical protein
MPSINHEALEKKQTRAVELLAQCRECVELVVKSVTEGGLEEARIEHFYSVSPPLLLAFIKS